MTRHSSTQHGDSEGVYRRADTLSCGPRGDYQPLSLTSPTAGASLRLRTAPLPVQPEPLLPLPEQVLVPLLPEPVPQQPRSAEC